MHKDKNINKTFKAFGISVFILAMVVFGLGIWGFIELINWITTK
jgi:uncharacterized membrane protein YiaA